MLDDIEEPLESINFLARAPNRLRILDVLTRGPVDRYDLEADTNIARATVGRNLESFVKRGWARREGHSFRATEVGEFVYEEFTALLEKMQPVQELAEIVKWIPDQGFDFDLHCLLTANVIKVTKENAASPVTHMVKEGQRAEQLRVLSYTVGPPVWEQSWERTRSGEQTLEAVFDPVVIALVKEEPELETKTVEMLETGRAEIYRYNGEVPYIIVIADDVVNLGLTDADGAPCAVIQTEDETVRSWAEGTIDSYRDDGDRLDVFTFTR